MAPNMHKQKMDMHLAWQPDQRTPTIGASLLTEPSPFPERDIQHPLPVRRMASECQTIITPPLLIYKSIALLLHTCGSYPPLNLTTASLTTAREGVSSSVVGSTPNVCYPAAWGSPVGGSPCSLAFGSFATLGIKRKLCFYDNVTSVKYRMLATH